MNARIRDYNSRARASLAVRQIIRRRGAEAMAAAAQRRSLRRIRLHRLHLRVSRAACIARHAAVLLLPPIARYLANAIIVSGVIAVFATAIYGFLTR